MFGLFKKKKDYPCYLTFKTNNKRNKTYKLYMHKGASKRLLKMNAVNPPITTVKHGKQVFFRFLKERDAYGLIMKLMSECNYSVDAVVRERFFIPFIGIIEKVNDSFSWYDNRYTYKDKCDQLRLILRKLIKLQDEWLKWLKTLNLNYQIPKIKYTYNEI